MTEAVRDSNEYFWPALERPDEHLTARPAAYSMGSVQEMQIILRYCYASWLETPGAMEVIKTRDSSQAW